MYHDINVDNLAVQLKMFRQQSFSCETVDDMTRKLASLQPAARSMFTEVERLTRLLLTLPASNAEAERSFSCLRRLKTFLRNSLGQQRLNHVAALNVHKKRLDAVSLEAITTEFIERCNNRRKVFGSPLSFFLKPD